ncbi:MAG: ATP-binding cassette domain-containing protein [Oceanospirillaceae bacterium]|nr:ATP-binding cassette domain-containing protein [Oceanospirillaceae bacterium]
MTLRVEKLRIYYPDWQREYDLIAEQGERLALKGPSGMGKTTLLMALAGFIAPISGSASWLGNDLLALPPEKRPIAMLFQDDNLFEHLSVAQNLRLGLTQEAFSEQLPRALSRLGLQDQLSKRPGQLSGGQRQRVGLVRTLLRPEPLVILDEPFAQLDAETRTLAIGFTLEQVVHSNKTLLLITHQDEDIAALATRTLHLDSQEA